MTFLIDVHLPISFSKFLNSYSYCTSIHINQVLQKWHTSDCDICKYADDNNLVVVTKDGDFKNSHFINHTPQKVIRVVLGNISNADLILLFTQHLPLILPLSAKKELYIEIGSQILIY